MFEQVPLFGKAKPATVLERLAFEEPEPAAAAMASLVEPVAAVAEESDIFSADMDAAREEAEASVVEELIGGGTAAFKALEIEEEAEHAADAGSDKGGR